MKFEQSHVLKELPKQFFASLVQKVNRKLSEGHDVINLGQEIRISRLRNISSRK